MGAPVGKLGERIEVGGVADGMDEEEDDGLGSGTVMEPGCGSGGRAVRVGSGVVVDGSLA